MYDGVPLIELDDDPEDLAQMFHFLWKPPLTEPEFGTLCSCIRISTKYLMDNVLAWCLGRLRDTIPYEAKHFHTSQAYYQSHPDRAAQVIALARKCDLPQYLPSAFYFLACEESGCAIPLTGPYAFSAEDVRRVHLGKRNIQRCWWDFIKRYDDMGLKSLRNSTYEWESASPVIVQIRTSALEAGAQDPIKYWMSRKATATSGKTHFDHKKDYAALCEKYGKKLYNDLPFIFDFFTPEEHVRKQRRSLKRPTTNGPAASGDPNEAQSGQDIRAHYNSYHEIKPDDGGNNGGGGSYAPPNGPGAYPDGTTSEVAAGFIDNPVLEAPETSESQDAPTSSEVTASAAMATTPSIVGGGRPATLIPNITAHPTSTSTSVPIPAVTPASQPPPPILTHLGSYSRSSAEPIETGLFEGSSIFGGPDCGCMSLDGTTMGSTGAFR
ncbi:hypothetical protein FRC01_006811 [Tulasnella sp. 417]|nr:hypothetical protein FRC01_006811 [Tulasnella sp. 417]